MGHTVTRVSQCTKSSILATCTPFLQTMYIKRRKTNNTRTVRGSFQ
jgi:hypothetical protein